MSNFINDSGQIQIIIDVKCLANVVSSKYLAVLFVDSYTTDYQCKDLYLLSLVIIHYQQGNRTLATQE